MVRVAGVSTERSIDVVEGEGRTMWEMGCLVIVRDRYGRLDCLRIILRAWLWHLPSVASLSLVRTLGSVGFRVLALSFCKSLVTLARRVTWINEI